MSAVNDKIKDNMICRACLCTDHKLLQPFLDNRNNLALYKRCTYLQINELDYLSKYLCTQCVNKCVSWNSFRELCVKNESTLKNNFKNNTPGNGIGCIGPNSLPGETQSANSKKIDTDGDQVKNIKFKEMKVVKLKELWLLTEKIDVKNEITIEAFKCPDDNLNNWRNIVQNTQISKPSEELLNEDTTKDLVSIPNPFFNNSTERINSKTPKTYALVKSSKFQCEICNKIYPKKSYFRQHFLLQHIEKSILCEICGKKFPALKSLKDHILYNHAAEKPFKCTICNRGFVSNFILKVHMRTHTGEKPYSCTLCENSYFTKDTLKTHMGIHMKEPPFKCTECNKGFARSAYLRLHMRIHTGEKPYQCKICYKKFRLAGAFENHKIKHTGERRFQCDICDKKLSRKSFLTVHMRTHTGEKPYPCTMCPKAFNVKHCLVSHMAGHTGEKLYVCQICDNKSFPNSKALNCHKKKVHEN